MILVGKNEVCIFVCDLVLIILCFVSGCIPAIDIYVVNIPALSPVNSNRCITVDRLFSMTGRYARPKY